MARSASCGDDGAGTHVCTSGGEPRQAARLVFERYVRDCPGGRAVLPARIAHPLRMVFPRGFRLVPVDGACKPLGGLQGADQPVGLVVDPRSVPPRLRGSTGRLVRSLTVAARFQTVLLWSNSEVRLTICSTYLRGLGVLSGKILPGPRTAPATSRRFFLLTFRRFDVLTFCRFDFLTFVCAGLSEL